MPRSFQRTIVYVMIFVLVVGTFLAGFGAMI
ncbi:stressosome-associated protein Prli42 [Natribacillus halophilus]|uniref:Stressosome-associated protein Prli42 n=1 Tax=Natribacillus halophilus TaxID=549003 RepID=A0A1G8JIB1_9BACI|nr:stressosome-associated protein Prli42 [Natribacillus halophilus]SDI30757.1 hypothetical protein SAMN04488123_101236 [Natribacillus halophilus]